MKRMTKKHKKENILRYLKIMSRIGKKNYKEAKAPIKRGRRVNYPELEAYLVSWIKEQREKKIVFW